MENQKYSRTLHAQISLGTTSDDRFMPSGYVEKFSQKDLYDGHMGQWYEILEKTKKYEA